MLGFGSVHVCLSWQP